jgi:hypothetical protein
LVLRALARELKSVLRCCMEFFLLTAEVRCAVLPLEMLLIAMPKLRL